MNYITTEQLKEMEEGKNYTIKFVEMINELIARYPFNNDDFDKRFITSLNKSRAVGIAVIATINEYENISTVDELITVGKKFYTLDNILKLQQIETAKLLAEAKERYKL